MSKHTRVAKMGSNDSKHGTQRSEIEKGDTVKAGLHLQHTGIVAKVGAREIIVNVNGALMAFVPNYVELAG